MCSVFISFFYHGEHRGHGDLYPYFFLCVLSVLCVYSFLGHRFVRLGSEELHEDATDWVCVLRISKTASRRGNRPAQFLCRLDPFSNDHLGIIKSFPICLPVSHAARKFGNLCHIGIIFFTPKYDYFVLTLHKSPQFQVVTKNDISYLLHLIQYIKRPLNAKQIPWPNTEMLAWSLQFTSHGEITEVR